MQLNISECYSCSPKYQSNKDSPAGLKEKLLSYLVCPSCNGSLELSVERLEQQEIMEGVLRCSACASSFPITRGVPRFAQLSDVESDKQATAANFGWQWQHFTEKTRVTPNSFSVGSRR